MAGERQLTGAEAMADQLIERIVAPDVLAESEEFALEIEERCGVERTGALERGLGGGEAGGEFVEQADGESGGGGFGGGGEFRELFAAAEAAGGGADEVAAAGAGGFDAFAQGDEDGAGLDVDRLDFSGAAEPAFGVEEAAGEIGLVAGGGEGEAERRDFAALFERVFDADFDRFFGAERVSGRMDAATFPTSDRNLLFRHGTLAQAAEQFDGGFDVVDVRELGLVTIVHVLVEGDFAFDGEGAGVADLLQSVDEVGHADGAAAERHFGAEGAGLGGVGPVAILGMDGDDVLADEFESGDGLRGAVEDEVGGVEVEFQVGAIDVLKEVEEGLGRLLAGFEGEDDAVFGGVVADAADEVADGGVVRVGVVFGDEADVAGEDGDAHGGGFVDDFVGAGFALGAGGGGDEADGLFDGGGVGVAFAIVGGENGGDDEAFVGEGLLIDGAEAGEGDGASEAEVAAADAERLDGADHLQRFGIAPEHQANF